MKYAISIVAKNVYLPLLIEANTLTEALLAAVSFSRDEPDLKPKHIPQMEYCAPDAEGRRHHIL